MSTENNGGTLTLNPGPEARRGGDLWFQAGPGRPAGAVDCGAALPGEPAGKIHFCIGSREMLTVAEDGIYVRGERVGGGDAYAGLMEFLKHAKVWHTADGLVVAAEKTT